MKNLVIVGYGGMGGWHAANAAKSDVVNLLGIYDIRECRRTAAEENGVYAYPDFKSVLDDPRIDLITVATPNDVHREIAEAAMNAGKNVISEKPVTICSSDLDAMIACSERTGKLFTVHQNRRWDNDFILMKQIYGSGELGNRVFNIESRVHGSRGIPGDWRGIKAHGGGMVLDWGVHLIDQALMMIDSPVTAVYARLDNITNEEVDDGCKIDIYFENGVVYRIEVGTSNFIKLPRFYMQGENGTAIIDDWGTPCRIVCCKNWDERDVVPIRTAAGLTKTMAPRDDKTITSYELPQPPSDVHDFYRNVCRAIDGLEPQLITHNQLRRVMHVMEASFASHESGQVIKGII